MAMRPAPGAGAARGRASAALRPLLAAVALLAARAVRAARPGGGTGERDAGWAAGERIPLECADARAGTWGANLMCADTHEPLSFTFGIDSFAHCGVEVRSEAELADVRSAVVTATAATRPEDARAWHRCRVPVDRARSAFLPLDLPLLGEAGEDDLVLVENHMAFVFHADAVTGELMGAAAYAVRDARAGGAQALGVGSVLNAHGPVRWFNRHTFVPLDVARVNGASSAGASSFRAIAVHALVSVARMRAHRLNIPRAALTRSPCMRACPRASASTTASSDAGRRVAMGGGAAPYYGEGGGAAVSAESALLACVLAVLVTALACVIAARRGLIMRSIAKARID